MKKHSLPAQLKQTYLHRGLRIYIGRLGSRCGGIGRRARLKIWYSYECVGSTPSVGTISPQEKTICVTGIKVCLELTYLPSLSDTANFASPQKWGLSTQCLLEILRLLPTGPAFIRRTKGTTFR